MNRALFLDRDGILNIDKTYVYKYEDIEWVPGIFDLIEFANKNNLLVIVLTNQSGVAQGMYKEKDILILHEKMANFLRSKNIWVDDWYYCTEYESERRKPRPGMMIEAQKKHNIDLSKSFMIGDKLTDVLDIDGPQTYLLRGNYPFKEVGFRKPSGIFDHLNEILSAIKNAILEKD